MRCLALQWCLFNNSWRLLKWPQTQSYKLLIVSTMIVYNGSLELYINNKAFLFFPPFFPETISSRLSVRLSEKQGLPASFGSGGCAGLVMPAAQLLWIKRRRSVILLPSRACPNTTKTRKTIGIGKGIHISARFSSGGGKQL